MQINNFYKKKLRAVNYYFLPFYSILGKLLFNKIVGVWQTRKSKFNFSLELNKKSY